MAPCTCRRRVIWEARLKSVSPSGHVTSDSGPAGDLPLPLGCWWPLASYTR